MEIAQSARRGPVAEGRILVIDDEWAIRDILQTILVAEGYGVDCAENGEGGISMIANSNYDLVITDLLMPGIGGEQVVTDCRRLRPEAECIITSGIGAAEASQIAARIGAFEALPKPFNFEQLKTVIRRARELQQLRAENSELQSKLSGISPKREFIGHSESVASLRHVLRTVAATDTTILIHGETGSGRELAAREIHCASPRNASPFITVNCSAIPEDALESELFGVIPSESHDGAPRRRGWLESANGGTIYLEEIGDLPLRTQARLLRAIESKVIYANGANPTIQLDVRIIACTSRDLEAAVVAGLFRADLFYRLNVIPIRVPSLRERREDIPLLVAQLAEERSRRDGRPPVQFSPQAIACLIEHDWPGNMRELMNFVEHMALLHSGGEVDVRHLPDSHRAARMRAAARAVFEQSEGSVDFNHLVDEYERALIDLALRKARGVKNHAASLLRLKRTTLVEKMKKKNIEPNPYADLSQSGS